MSENLETIFTSEQIDAILPHRYPFALVDKVIEYEAGKRAVGIKCVTKVRRSAKCIVSYDRCSMHLTFIATSHPTTLTTQ